MTLEIDVLTLFPSMITGPLSESIPGRIQERGLVDLRVHDLREFGLGRHRSVDDTPYGGGAGMVMRVEPLVAAIESVRRPGSLVILLDPGGEVFSHGRAADLATRAHLVLVCPRYEGVDERIRSFVDLELSIGDYVADGWRAAGARGHRRCHPSAARGDRCGLDRGGIVRGRAVWSIRSTRGRRPSAGWMCQRS